MIAMLVSYAGDEKTPFNRDRWINVHFSIVRECWGPYGPLSVSGFSPQGGGGGLIAFVHFRDEEAMLRRRSKRRPPLWAAG